MAWLERIADHHHKATRASDGVVLGHFVLEPNIYTGTAFVFKARKITLSEKDLVSLSAVVVELNSNLETEKRRAKR